MSRDYKTVKNGRGTDLIIGEGKYVSVGAGGTDITIKGDGKVLAFDDWNGLIDTINEDEAVYCKHDLTDDRYRVEK